MGISRDLRVRVVRDDAPDPGGDYVLYWMSSCRRLEDSHALDRALAWSRELNKPLAVFEALRADYRWACPRHHRIILDAMAEHGARCARAKLTYLPFVEREAGAGKGLLRALDARAAVTVADRNPGFFFPRMLEAARQQTAGRLEVVDDVGLLPMDVAPGPLPSAYVLRRRIQKNLPDWIGQTADEDPLARYRGGLATLPEEIGTRWQATPVEDLARSARLEEQIPLAHAVPISDWEGGSAPARQRLREFVQAGLPRYDELRMEASPASGLSMALHYGFLSPQRVLQAVLDREGRLREELRHELVAKTDSAKGARAGWWGLSPEAEAFLDQLTTWRELGHRFTEQRPDCEQYGSQPDWAVATLDAHRSDVREYAYTRKQFEEARTHDPLWNAAQRCLVREGWMPNYLRMLWGKCLLWWSQDPEEAWDTLFHLNNLYALDGRDPNSMSGISWVFGRFDRPFGPERPVIGKLRPMSVANTKRKMNLGDFLDRFDEVPRLFV